MPDDLRADSQLPARSSARREAHGSIDDLMFLVGKISNGTDEVDCYLQASKLVIQCLDTRTNDQSAAAAFALWSDEPKRAFLELLLMQPNCSARPFVFLHLVCSFASSGVNWVAPAVANALLPIIVRLIEHSEPPVAAVLATIVLREFFPGKINQQKITKLHLRNFHRFGREDIALPYSVMFTAHLYRRNRDDLLKAFRVGNPELQVARFSSFHLLLIEWLSSRSSPLLWGHKDLLVRLTALLCQDDDRGSHEDNLCSGRTILARHVAGDEQINQVFSSKLSEALAVTPAYRGTLMHLSAARERVMDSLVGRQRTFPTYFGSKKSYQALHALANESRRFLGGRFRSSRRPRVAICVSGQLRGFREAFATWKSKVLPHVDGDIFVHTWRQVGYSGAEPFRHVLPFQGANFIAAYREQCIRFSHEVVRQRYPTLFGTLSKSGTVTASELSAFYGTDFVQLEDDDDMRFDSWSNSEKMHYKIQACFDLAVAQGRQYDLVIRVRPDLPVSFLGFSWRELMGRCYSEPLILADAAMGVNYGHVMMGDQCAIGSPDTMRVYSGTYSIYPQLGMHKLFNFPPRLAGHVSIAYVCWLHGIRVERMPIKWKPLLDPTALTTAAILETITKDSSSRDDHWDRTIISAAKSDIQRSQQKLSNL